MVNNEMTDEATEALEAVAMAMTDSELKRAKATERRTMTRTAHPLTGDPGKYWLAVQRLAVYECAEDHR